MILHVIYQVSDQEDKTPRPLGMTKKQAIGACFPRLLKSVETLGEACKITVLANKLDDDTSEFFCELKQKTPFTFASPVNIQEKAFEAADLIKGDGDAWVYFCKDDYLHDSTNFMPRFLDFVSFSAHKKFALPVFYYPADDVESYQENASRCQVFQLITGYVRETPLAPMHFLCSMATYRTFAMFLQECRDDARKFSNIFKYKAFCFNPMPGTASRIRENKMGRYVDWQSLIYSP